MKILCTTCKELILETSDEFICGGPYDGSMFKGITDDKYRATMFRTLKEVTHANLHCPRCIGEFINRDGAILTEHGLLPAGQRTVDTSVHIIHQEGPAKGILGHIVPAKEAEEPEEIATDDDLVCPKCGKEYKQQPWLDKHIANCEG